MDHSYELIVLLLRRVESHNVTSHRKVPVQKSTLCSYETPSTPYKNEEISGEQVNVQASHSGLISFL